MIFNDSFLNIFFGSLVAFTAIIIAYYKWSFQYWKKRNVPHNPPSIPLGNIINPLSSQRTSVGVRMGTMYKEFKARGWRHAGYFMMASPNYFVTDLDYVKNILTKDFQYFVDRGFYVNEKDDPIGAHLFGLGGPKWRNLRTKLTPTFTSGKMKMMFSTLVECQDSLQEIVAEKCAANEAIDIKEVLACFTTDIIGSCAFGLDCKSFKEENSPFRKYGRKVFESSILQTARMIFALSFPDLGRALGVRQNAKDIGDFFTKVVNDTVEYREKNNVSRKDFMQLLIELKNAGDGNNLTMEEIAAQSFIFFLAGFETSSSLMTFALYEMAKDQEVQQKVRDEINTVLARHGGEMTYEAITEMKYMGQVLDETLRKYPPVPFITRECVKDYKVPDQDTIIEKGIRVIIPIYGIHYDEEYYPDPERFDPERFTEENKNSRHQYAHIPFGEGPRICIGLRFGIMQSKVGLTSLLSKYKFRVNSKTQEPLVMDKFSFILTTTGGMWLNAEKL